MAATNRNEQQSSNIFYNIDNLPIRTVRFTIESTDNDMWTFDEIESFFSRFGCISSLSINDTQYSPDIDGFVQFRRGETAAEVLNHRMFNSDSVPVSDSDSKERYELYVEAADSWHQPGWHGIVPTSFSFGDDVDPNTRMSDDCLREIFDHLNVWDLVSVADVCSRFEQIAQERFAKKYKSVNFNDFLFKEVGAGDKLTGQRICNFFKHFGSFIVELDITRYHPSNLHHITPNEILMLIIMHCSGTLEVLKIRRFTLENPFVKTSHSLFAHLKKLYLLRCVFKDGVMRALANCKELTKLKIDEFSEVDDTDSEFDFTLPALTTISLKNNFSMDVKEIVQRNPRLKRITINRLHLESEMLSDIVQYTPDVEKLSFKGPTNFYLKGDQSHLLTLAQLTSLKKLAINTIGNSIGLLLSNMAIANVPLEHLSVYGNAAEVNSGKFINGVGAMKTIRSLRIIFASSNGVKKSNFFKIIESLPELTKFSLRKEYLNFNADDLKEIIRRAPKLGEIDWRDSRIQFTEATFISLVQAVQSRGPPFPLKIIASRCSPKFFGLSQQILDIHKDKVILTWHT